MRDQAKNRTVEPFASSVQHLLAELERLDVRIHAQVQYARQSQPVDDEFRGLYISEQDVDKLLAQPTGASRWTQGFDPARKSTAAAGLEHLRNAIDCRKTASISAGVPLRGEQLCRCFELTEFDFDVVLICLAPELDLRYERLYAYLQDDVTKKRPSVDLTLNLLCPSFDDKLSARARFGADSPLLRHNLISVFEDQSRQKPTQLGKFLKLDERICDFLLGSDGIDSRLHTIATLAAPGATLDGLGLPGDIKMRLRRLAGTAIGEHDAFVLYLQGPYGVGKQAAAESFAAAAARRLLIVDGQRLESLPEDDYEHTLRLIAREARLQDAALYWKSFDSLLAEDRLSRLSTFVNMLEARRDMSLLAGNKSWEPAGVMHDTPFLRIELDPPRYSDRVRLWTGVLRKLVHSDDIDAGDLAGRFRLSGGQIRDAVATAGNLACWRDPACAEITMADLNNACRLQSNRNLSRLAQKIKPRYGWNDIVLPAKRMQQLREICNAALYSPTVYSDWGFGAKLSLGKGLGVLFSGPSGTGKTLAAEIISNELSLDMYKIDLSTVVSKYIGETEKNLSHIFTEAETANAILFFDEADALFGRRSEVRDSHDRYANIEIGYLLQRMEEYDGFVILATNLDKNMDEAFVRRLHFTLEFPLPREKDRLRIWQGIWPEKTPLNTDVDLDFMAGRFEIPGGNIKNIALAAAFLAAEDGAGISMRHLIIATLREYDKMGRIIMAEEFGEYRGLLAAT